MSGESLRGFAAVDRLSGAPGVLATAGQTVVVKGWDGFLLALVT